MISAKTIQMQEERQKSMIPENEEIWLTTDKIIVCQPCLAHMESEDIPKELKLSKKGNFGYIKKKQGQFTITAVKKTHIRHPLHVWCVTKQEKVKNSKAKIEAANVRSGEKVIRNALFCFKRGLGAADFVALNEKDVGSDIQNTATKNDSKAEYFKLRNTIFELVSEKTRIFFKNDIKFITVTLHKVTVQRTSYTVFLTFFFFEGKTKNLDL